MKTDLKADLTVLSQCLLNDWMTKMHAIRPSEGECIRFLLAQIFPSKLKEWDEG